MIKDEETNKILKYNIGDKILLKNNSYVIKIVDIVIYTKSIYYVPLECYVLFKLKNKGKEDYNNNNGEVFKMKMVDFLKILERDLNGNFNITLYLGLSLIIDETMV